MHSQQLAAVTALQAELDAYKIGGFSDAIYKPMVTQLRRIGDEPVEQKGIPNSLILALVEAAFGAAAYESVLHGGATSGVVAGYRANAMGSPMGAATLAIRLV